MQFGAGLILLLRNKRYGQLRLVVAQRFVLFLQPLGKPFGYSLCAIRVGVAVGDAEAIAATRFEPNRSSEFVDC